MTGAVEAPAGEVTAAYADARPRPDPLVAAAYARVSGTRTLTTKLHGRHSVRWTTGEHAEAKAILLDSRILRRSVSAIVHHPPTTKGSP
jgi:hypothetical protein